MGEESAWGHPREVPLPCADAHWVKWTSMCAKFILITLEWQLTQCQADVTGTLTLTLWMRKLRPRAFM